MREGPKEAHMAIRALVHSRDSRKGCHDAHGDVRLVNKYRCEVGYQWHEGSRRGRHPGIHHACLRDCQVKG